mmetsp:Transcript_28912/g.83529  ORF Transcript_28912/g.83529 Transcript_28912/m.83529 type:complete len:94 (-) Transcript_28912:954-1235(-)
MMLAESASVRHCFALHNLCTLLSRPLLVEMKARGDTPFYEAYVAFVCALCEFFCTSYHVAADGLFMRTDVRMSRFVWILLCMPLRHSLHFTPL